MYLHALDEVSEAEVDAAHPFVAATTITERCRGGLGRINYPPMEPCRALFEFQTWWDPTTETHSVKRVAGACVQATSTYPYELCPAPTYGDLVMFRAAMLSRVDADAALGFLAEQGEQGVWSATSIEAVLSSSAISDARLAQLDRVLTSVPPPNLALRIREGVAKWIEHAPLPIMKVADHVHGQRLISGCENASLLDCVAHLAVEAERARPEPTWSKLLGDRASRDHRFDVSSHDLRQEASQVVQRQVLDYLEVLALRVVVAVRAARDSSCVDLAEITLPDELVSPPGLGGRFLITQSDEIVVVRPPVLLGDAPLAFSACPGQVRLFEHTRPYRPATRF